MKTAMNELLDWINQKPVKPTYINMKEKIWQLLPKEKNQIEDSYIQGFCECEHIGIMDVDKYYNKNFNDKRKTVSKQPPFAYNG